MNLRDTVHADLVSLDFSARNKDEVLQHIARLATQSPACSVAEDEVYRALQQRERMGSTGFEKGIAIPHTRLEGLTDFVVGVVVLPEGVNFKAADRKPTHLVVYILGPPERPNDHVKLLSAISRALSRSEVREGLLAAPDADAAIELLGRHSPAGEGKPERVGSLVTVVVQIEKAFLDVLQSVSSETSDISVLNGSDAAEFLHALPLYAVLWDDEPMPFHRVIIASVERGVVPSLMDELRRIIDNLESERGVLVLVQDLAYCYGSLKAIPG